MHWASLAAGMTVAHVYYVSGIIQGNLHQFKPLNTASELPSSVTVSCMLSQTASVKRGSHIMRNGVE